MKDRPLDNVYAYAIDDRLYINLTNRCSNACSFCIRETTDGLGNKGSLWLASEPTVEEIIKAVGDPSGYSEIVFCGFGEPLARLSTLVQVARALKKYNIPLRINTNGQANLIHERNIVPDLMGLIDRISISLNAENAEKYQEICNSQYGLKAYEAILDFTKLCVGTIPEVILSVVDREDIDLEACREIAEKLGARLRIRRWNPSL